jgi:hypothetical protein
MAHLAVVAEYTELDVETRIAGESPAQCVVEDSAVLGMDERPETLP